MYLVCNRLFSLIPYVFKTNCSVVCCPMPPPFLTNVFLEGRRLGQDTILIFEPFKDFFNKVFQRPLSRVQMVNTVNRNVF